MSVLNLPSSLPSQKLKFVDSILACCAQDLPASTRFAIYSDDRKQLWTVSSYEGVRSQLEGGRSDIFTVVPIWEGDRTEFAPIGLTNMLNTGGTISAWNPDNHGSQYNFKVPHFTLIHGHISAQFMCMELWGMNVLMQQTRLWDPAEFRVPL